MSTEGSTEPMTMALDGIATAFEDTYMPTRPIRLLSSGSKERPLLFGMEMELQQTTKRTIISSSAAAVVNKAITYIAKFATVPKGHIPAM
jgi:hypothetical protein